MFSGLIVKLKVILKSDFSKLELSKMPPIKSQQSKTDVVKIVSVKSSSCKLQLINCVEGIFNWKKAR